MAYLGRDDTPVPTKGRGSKLTGKQLRFVEEYMVDCNASKAVIRAGYKTTTQNRLGVELMRHPLIKKEINERLDNRKERMELTSDYIIGRLIALAENATREGDQLRALELLGKTMALFKERQEISGPDGEAIKHEQKVREDVADFTRAIAKLAERNRKTGVAEVTNTGTEG